jgi:hypothetical protein
MQVHAILVHDGTVMMRCAERPRAERWGEMQNFVVDQPHDVEKEAQWMKKPAEALHSDIQKTNGVFQILDGSPQSPFYLSNLQRPTEDKVRKISMAATMAWSTIERSFTVFNTLLQTRPLQGRQCPIAVRACVRGTPHPVGSHIATCMPAYDGMDEPATCCSNVWCGGLCVCGSRTIHPPGGLWT